VAISPQNRALSVGFCAAPAFVCLLVGAIEAKPHMLLFGVSWTIWAIVSFRYPQRYDVPLREAFRSRLTYDRHAKRLNLIAQLTAVAAGIVWVAQ
jgi:hypothetical protein